MEQPIVAAVIEDGQTISLEAEIYPGEFEPLLRATRTGSKLRFSHSAAWEFSRAPDGATVLIPKR